MKKLFYNIFLLVCYLPSFSQNKQNDSLWQVFNNKNVADTVRLDAMETIVWSYNSNDPDTCIILAEKEIEIASSLKSNGGRRWIANALYIIGVAYMNKGDYEKALEYNFKFSKICIELARKNSLANCYNNIGNIYNYLSNYNKSLEYYLMALKIREEKGDKKYIGQTYGNIGSVYIELFDYEKALNYYHRSLAIANEIGDKEGISRCYTNIGIALGLQNNYPKAMEYNLKALKILEEAGDKKGLGSCLSNIANVYGKQSNYQKAGEYYLRALKLREEIGDIRGVGSCYVNMGFLYIRSQDFKLAIKCGDSAIRISKKIGDIDNERLSFEIMACAYGKIGKYKEAYVNEVKFKELTDSIFNAENSKQLGDMKTNYEVEKKATELKIKAEAEKEKAAAINKEEKKTQKIITGSVIFGLILVLIFSVIIFKRLRVTRKQKQIIEIKERETQMQKHLIEEKHKEITDSINYAERIQRSFLATKTLLDENLNEYFVMFQPKDVVSGDFYWAGKLNNGNFALATADSTGHGVPGAIMSLLNITSLEKAIENTNQPNEILNATRKTIIERLKKDGSAEGGKDGMDVSLTVYDPKKKKLIIAAANNPVWIMRGNETIEIKPDKMPVGKHDKDSVSFTQQEIDLQKDDAVYTLTDGFPDQFGGEKGKKFMSKNLRELLATNAHLPMAEQKIALAATFKNWAGDLEQVDDVTLIGIRI